MHFAILSSIDSIGPMGLAHCCITSWHMTDGVTASQAPSRTQHAFRCTFRHTVPTLSPRYALEEARYGYDHEPPPWTKWDTLHLVRYLLQNGAAPSINQQGNSALACVLRHVRDWEFR